MKQIMLGISLGMITIFALMLLLTVENRHTREADFDRAFDTAMAVAAERLIEYADGEETDEKLSRDFQTFLEEELNNAEVDTAFSVTADIKVVDAANGLFSADASATFSHPNGEVGTVEKSGTIVLEQERNRKICTVRYLLPKETAAARDLPRLYATYVLMEDEPCRVPEIDAEDNVSVKKWRLLKGGEDGGRFENGKAYRDAELERIDVDEDLTFEAVL